MVEESKASELALFSWYDNSSCIILGAVCVSSDGNSTALGQEAEDLHSNDIKQKQVSARAPRFRRLHLHHPLCRKSRAVAMTATAVRDELQRTPFVFTHLNWKPC